MQTLLPTCKSFAFLNPPSSFNASTAAQRTVGHIVLSGLPKTIPFSKFSAKFRFLSNENNVIRLKGDSFIRFSNTQLPENDENDENLENVELGLLNKPSLVGVDTEASRKSSKDEALEPFMKFFKQQDSVEQVGKEGGGELGVSESRSEELEKVIVEYYEPKPGDFVVGVVVSGNENKLDVNVGADMLGTMLTKDVLPLYNKDMEYLLCDRGNNLEGFMVNGKMGIVRDDDAMSGEPVPGRPVVETGTVLFAEVLGRTLSGRPLLSTRRFFRRIAWHRVRQIKQLNEPIEVQLTEWNTGGLLTKIEGLRAFLPKAELMKRVNNFTDLKEYVGGRMYVLITRVNEANNDLILSEREAWEMMHLREGTLVDGTVKKILPYGAQIQISESNRSGLLHISNISRSRVSSVAELLKEGEKVKVLVAKSLFPEKISLSTADLESEPGLFISNKERVFAEAEEMAKRYRQKVAVVIPSLNTEPSSTEAIPFGNEASLYANWEWFKFEVDNDH